MARDNRLIPQSILGRIDFCAGAETSYLLVYLEYVMIYSC
jgi:hypothetical protein